MERWSPEPNHTGALLRLRSIVEEESGCRFVMAVFVDSAYRDRLIDHVATLMEHSRVLDIGDMSDFEVVEEELTIACHSASLVHLTGARAWLSDDDRAAELLHGLNYRRERLAARCASTVVIWVDERAVQRVAQGSPDFWAWRAGLLSFVSETRVSSMTTAGLIEHVRADKPAMQRRLKDLRSYLDQRDELQPSHILLLLEMSEIEKSLGELDDVEKSASEARQLAVQFDDKLNEAAGWGHIADIREARGDTDEALRIRREEQLPVYKRLGDVRSVAVTMGKIADVLQQRGETDEALRIRREEQLPVFERLGDVRSRAVTLQKIASALLEPEGLTQANAKVIVESLSESFVIATKLDDPLGMASVGLQLGRILAAVNEREQALQTLATADSAFERLGDVEGRSRVAALRQRIEQGLETIRTWDSTSRQQTS